jgi:hypothetical protein
MKLSLLVLLISVSITNSKEHEDVIGKGYSKNANKDDIKAVTYGKAGNKNHSLEGDMSSWMSPDIVESISLIIHSKEPSKIEQAAEIKTKDVYY